jgi:hypothetical protein
MFIKSKRALYLLVFKLNLYIVSFLGDDLSV